MCVCVCVCMYMYVYVYTRIFVCVCMCMCACVRVCVTQTFTGRFWPLFSPRFVLLNKTQQYDVSTEFPSTDHMAQETMLTFD